MISETSPSRSAERTLRLFEAFAATGKPQTLSNLARHIGVPVSTCHGLIRTLQGLGYLYSLSGSRQLYPTKKLTGIADRIARNDPVVERVSEALTGLRDMTGETVIFGARQGDAVIYLDVRESRHVIRYSARPGDLKPLHSSAIGKLVLGELEEAERRATLERLTLEQITPATLVKTDDLRDNLEEGRRAGCYVTRGDNVAEVMAMAAPVRISGDVFGVALAGPVERMARQFEKYQPILLEASAAMSRWT